jgi:hypothetical protein
MERFPVIESNPDNSDEIWGEADEPCITVVVRRAGLSRCWSHKPHFPRFTSCAIFNHAFH